MPQPRNLGVPNPEAEAPQRVGGQNYLLAIGIDQYEYVGKLKNCVADARAFVKVLEEQYGFSRDHIREFYNEAATRAHIVEELDRLSETLGEKDNLIIYFAGHGVYKARSKMGFLVPVGGKSTSVASLIFNGLIRSYIQGFEAHHVFLVVDSCFSGDLIRRSRGEGSGPIETYAKRVDGKPSRWGLAAGRIEEVTDGIAGNHSPFNKTLVTFLKTHSASQFAVSELINHVCKITTYNADQTPIGGILDKAGHQGGEFVFRRKEFGVQANVDPLQKDLSAWNEAKRAHSVEGYKAYLRAFPKGGFVLLAQKALERSQKQMVTVKTESHRKAKLQEYYHGGLELIEERAYEDALECLQEALAIAKKGEKKEIEKAITLATKELEKTVPKAHPLLQELGIEMILVKGGSFQMGSNENSDEKPIHEVILSDFYLAKTACTFAQFDYFCKQTKRQKPVDRGRRREDRPACCRPPRREPRLPVRRHRVSARQDSLILMLLAC